MNRALSIVFFSAVFIAFLTPMELGDVWWHLKTGHEIWLNKSIPDSDLFSLGGQTAGKGSPVLSAFWLCQILLYGIYRLGDVLGLIALKAVLFTSTYLVLNGVLKTYGLKAPLRYLCLLPSAFAAAYYDEIRPQTFSFLFFALVIYFLEKSFIPEMARLYEPHPVKKIPLTHVLLLPLIMLIWSNMHGGFVIGTAFISFYALWLFFKSASTKSLKNRHVLFLLSILAVSAALSGLNPNGFNAIPLTWGALHVSAKSDSQIHEHFSMREFASFTGDTPLYALIALLTVIGLLSFILKRKKPDLPHLIIFLGLALLSFITFRAGMFFSIIAVMAIGKNLSEVSIPFPSKKIFTGRFFSLTLIAAALLIIFFTLIPRTILRQPAVNEGLIPVKAANFIQSERLPGNLYHPYEWGGYLIWRLSPPYKVFIDGRSMGLQKEYQEVLKGVPQWEEILNKHNVNTVIYWPVLPYGKKVPPIVFSLLKSDDWSPVYWDISSIAFVRAGLAKNPIKKASVWELLTSLISADIRAHPSDPRHYAALGVVYLEKGLRYDAQKAFGKALLLDPNNKEAGFWQKVIYEGNNPGTPNKTKQKPY